MNFKQAQVATDTPILFSVLVFEGFIIFALGFLNINAGDVTTQSSGNVIFSFGNIITGIKLLGWGNTLLFAPIIIVMLYIIAKLIRGGG